MNLDRKDAHDESRSVDVASCAETSHPALSRLTRAEQALAQAKDLSEIKQIIDIAEAARVWARAARQGEDCARHAEEIKLKAQRKAGEFLACLEKDKGGRANSAQPVRSSSDYRKAIEDADIGRGSAQRWQQVAAIPGAVFQSYIDIKTEAREEISTAGLLREAKAHRNGALFRSDSAEWYTPSHVIDLVVTVLGAVDLDPCSNSHQNPNVPAATHYTQPDDGLLREWVGKVYMNPPYGDAITEWIQKLESEYRAGRVTEAIALVPARTETRWFRQLRDFPVCFIAGRLKFIGGQSSAPFPSAVRYLGPNTDRFEDAFGGLGDIYVRQHHNRERGAAA